MNKLLVLVTFLFISYVYSSAQSFGVRWGDPVKRSGKRAVSFILGGDDKNFYVIDQPTKVNELRTYDLGGKLRSGQQLALKYGKKNVIPQDIVELKNGRFVYMNAYDNKAKSMALYTAKFDKGKMEDVKITYEMDYAREWKFAFFGLYGYTNRDISGLKVSKDKSHAVHVSSISTKDAKSPDQINIVVFNENFEVKWKKLQTFKYEDNRMSVTDMVITNNGDVLLAAKIWKDKSERKSGLPNYDFKVFKISKGGIEEYELFAGSDLIPSEIGMFEGDDNHAYLGGFFTERGKNIGEKGVCFVDLNLEDGTSQHFEEEFDSKFLSGLVKAKNINKGKGVSRSFNIDEMIVFDDGSVSFIAEKAYTTTVTYFDSEGRARTRTIYHSDEIIVPRFKKSGELIALEKIDKDYSSSSTMPLYYAFAVQENRLYLVFNDRKTNAERADMATRNAGKRARYTDLVIIGDNGKIDRKIPLFNSKEIDTEFIPYSSLQVGDKLIFKGLSKKEEQYGVLNLH